MTRRLLSITPRLIVALFALLFVCLLFDTGASNKAMLILISAVIVLMITWGVAIELPMKPQPQARFLMMFAVLLPPVLWFVGLHRFYKFAVRLPGIAPACLAGLGVFFLWMLIVDAPLSRHPLILSGALFAIVEPIMVFLAAQTYWWNRSRQASVPQMP